MLGFLITLSYISGATLNFEKLSGANLREYVTSIRRAFGFIVVEGEDGLLLLFLIFALFSRKIELVIASAATLALVWALTYVNYHGTVSIGYLRGHLFEVREYLFGLGCLFYSLELALAQGRLAAISRAPFSGLKLPGGRIPFLMMTCYLVIAGSIGLVFFQYFNGMTRPLPDYEITSIRTGQFIPEEGEIWTVEFPVGAVE